jgi:hypothetical protein
MYQQLWAYKIEEELHLGVREQKKLGTTAVDRATSVIIHMNTYYNIMMGLGKLILVI